MICAIVPVKSLTAAKGRLARILAPAERRALVQAMLGDVLMALLASQRLARVGVISSDPAVLAQALALGAEALPDQSRDLNAALDQAARHYARAGATATLVLPADVPLVASSEIDELLAASRGARGALLAPSHDGGTNALLAWPPLALPFCFGPSSLALHTAAAYERGISLRRFHRPGLELDIDQPDDLWQLAEAHGSTAAQQLVRELNIYERIAYV